MRAADTYRKKNKLLALGFCVMLLLVYFLALKKTWALKNECAELEKKSMLVNDMPLRLAGMKKQIAEMEKYFGSGKDTAIKLQDQLLGSVTAYCRENGTTLREFPGKTSQKEGDFRIDTYQFTAEGTFIKLLKLLYNLEQGQKTGKIASADFFSKRDLKTKQLSLQASVYIQDVKKLEKDLVIKENSE